MARQTSKGVCTFCHGEFSKAAMTRHLETCEQRAITEAKAGSKRKALKTRAFHLLVEGRDLPMYWMHLEVSASTTLATLDRFLRDTWLECCGHLSAFELGGVRYAVDAGMDDGWDMNEKSMRVLARNMPPVILCEGCGKPATYVCSQCIFDEKGWLCDGCAEDHECGEEMLLPVVNSPRVGMCAYTG